MYQVVSAPTISLMQNHIQSREFAIKNEIMTQCRYGTMLSWVANLQYII